MDEKNEALNEVVEEAQTNENEEPTEAEDAQDEPFVHQGKTRITQEPISDSDHDDEYQGPYEHDSDFTVSSGLLGKLSDRRSQAQIGQLRRDLHYGQYLEVPKGRRDIFVSKERATRAKSVIALLVVLAALAAVGWFVVQFLYTRFG